MNNDADLLSYGAPEQYARNIASSQSGGKTQEKKHTLYSFLKRLFDVLLSFFAIIVLLPLFLLLAVAIKLDSKGPVIYSQMRAGKSGKPFKLYKFRSMCIDAEEKLEQLKDQNEKNGPIFKIANDPRVTRVGRFIRKVSIDELPQLINILKGEMSIVGPRPPLLSEMEQYTLYQMQRLDVTPGLTCYWQISGRSDIDFNQWVELDLKYIRECGLWTDLRIILKTVPAVLLARGAY
ncbi:MAG TPA: sugar transferase [Caproiciproducens sp.]|nr:sugar transferase [Caproiciproducens sp.]